MGVTVNIAGDDGCPFETKNVNNLVKFVKNKDMYFLSFWEIGKSNGIKLYKEMINKSN